MPEPIVTSCGKYYLQSFGEQYLFLGQSLENVEALFLWASKHPSLIVEVILIVLVRILAKLKDFLLEVSSVVVNENIHSCFLLLKNIVSYMVLQ